MYNINVREYGDGQNRSIAIPVIFTSQPLTKDCNNEPTVAPADLHSGYASWNAYSIIGVIIIDMVTLFYLFYFVVFFFFWFCLKRIDFKNYVFTYYYI